MRQPRAEQRPADDLAHPAVILQQDAAVLARGPRRRRCIALVGRAVVERFRRKLLGDERRRADLPDVGVKLRRDAEGQAGDGVGAAGSRAAGAERPPAALPAPASAARRQRTAPPTPNVWRNWRRFISDLPSTRFGSIDYTAQMLSKFHQNVIELIRFCVRAGAPPSSMKFIAVMQKLSHSPPTANPASISLT